MKTKWENNVSYPLFLLLRKLKLKHWVDIVIPMRPVFKNNATP